MKLSLFIATLICLTSVHAAILPNRSELEVRLLHRVGSRISHVGDLVQAVIISPVFDSNTVLIPPGAIVSGVVEHLDRLGLGLRHTAARLDLQFTKIHFSDGSVIPISARLASVEEAREIVTDTGTVIGIHPSASFSTGVSCLFTLSFIGAPEFRLPVLAFKFLAARSPDAEITFPAGTEMVLRLTRDVELHNPPPYTPAVPLLSASQGAYLQRMLALLPQQQTSRNGKLPADLINIALIGTQQAVERAFRAAGWTDSEPHGVMALYHMYHCLVQRAGYSRAPVTNLEFNGKPPNVIFQKSLDTLAKRHHVRLWRDEQSDLWFGAATEDVKYKIEALHITHGIDPYIDNERAKIVNDLAFTGCIDRGSLIPRTSLKDVRTDTGLVQTDGDIAVLQLNACNDPRVMPKDPEMAPPSRATLAALAVSEDIARSNPVSVGYAMAKSLFHQSKARVSENVRQSRTYTRNIEVSRTSGTDSPAVLALR